MAELLADLVGRHGVPAAQLAIHADGRTVAVTAGAAGAVSAVSAEAKFPVGSITKACTASLAMLLVADDDLDLDDRIGEYLPDLGSGSDGIGGTLTVRQLLSHTSGLPSSLGDGSDAVLSPSQYLRDSRALALVQPAGHGFSYSNVGYVLIGRLVEEITGMNWWEAVEALLLTPLGIVPSYVVRPDARQPADSFVSGHAVDPATGRAVPVTQTMRLVEAACGALALSARDLLTFGHAHLAGCAEPGISTPLDPDAFGLMRSPVSGAEPFGLADGWGLGLALFRDAGTDWFGHDGTADGTSCHLRIDPAHDRVVALTTNANTGSALWDELVCELRTLGIPVGSYAQPELTGRIPVPVALFGSYSNGAMEYVVDAVAGGEVNIVINGEAYPELALHDDWAFSVREPVSGRRILGGRFLMEPSTGQVIGIQTGGRVAGLRKPFF